MQRLRFCGRLARLARGADARGVVAYELLRRASIKDVVESLGVPHTEIFGVRVVRSMHVAAADGCMGSVHGGSGQGTVHLSASPKECVSPDPAVSPQGKHSPQGKPSPQGKLSSQEEVPPQGEVPPNPGVSDAPGGQEDAGFDLLLDPQHPLREVILLPEDGPVDVSRPTRLRPYAWPGVRYLADENVARLGRLLRTLGLDAAEGLEGARVQWPGNAGTPTGRGGDKARHADAVDAALARRASEEKRILLSADRALLKRSEVVHGMLVLDHDPMDQLVAVLGRYPPDVGFRPFSRCLRCNVPLQPVEKDRILHLLQPKTIKYYDDFSRCPRCGGVFWQGSHHQRMLARLERRGVLNMPK